ncbi:hypothetical protein QQF64_011972 [Cirrhinus molitorella]|uniref:HAT C-terminal dimerisation domain-containing protein n=1 Tax=Cirrhinus molitorella TaxID=172907 RepID=A0ABR3LU51_9TELE
MHGSHTGEYIKDSFLHMLKEWKINKDRVVLVLRDNGANMVKGLRLADIPDLSCTAHSLQLVVNDGLASQRAVIDVIAMLKKCVTHFQHSILAKQRLRNIQRDLGLPEHNLIQAVPTRWNSTLHMLHRALEQKRALNIYSVEHGGFTCPSAHQWDIVSKLVETLIPIEEVTLQVSYSNSSASSIIPCITVLKMLLEDKGPSTQGIGTLREVMRESLTKRFNKLEDSKVVVLACLLDPRYKSHAFCFASTLNKAKEWLKEDVECGLQGQAETERGNQEQQADEEEPAAQDQAPKRQRREDTPCHSQIDKIFSSLFGPHTSDLLVKGTIEDELNQYLKEPVIERRKGDPLQWWKQNEGRFKLLAKAARKFLCSPSSSVPSERVFSEVSAIYDKKRSKLTGEHAEQLCFLHHNLVLLDWDY